LTPMWRGPCWSRVGGVDGRPIVIRLELRLEDDSLTGSASDGAGAAREFVGWTGLVAGLVPGNAPARAGDSTGAGDVGAAP
jgi:hypothetical protein